VSWFDPWVKRARLLYAAEDTLEYVPPWYGERMLALGEARVAAVDLSGPAAPGVLDESTRRARGATACRTSRRRARSSTRAC
jgi:hypothetical protein